MDNMCCFIPFSTCIKLLYKIFIVDSVVLVGKICWGIYFLSIAIRSQLQNKKDKHKSDSDDVSNLEIVGYYGAAISLILVASLRLISNAFLHRDAKRTWSKGDSAFSRNGVFSNNIFALWKSWLTLMIVSMAVNVVIAGVENSRGVLANLILGIIFSLWEFSAFLLIIIMRRSVEGHFHRRQLITNENSN